VANNKNPGEKQPGEKKPGTFHYNPGNMSEKAVGSDKAESEQSGDTRAHKQQDPKTKKPTIPRSRSDR
jgi:hypothetical protein